MALPIKKATTSYVDLLRVLYKERQRVKSAQALVQDDERIGKEGHSRRGAILIGLGLPVAVSFGTATFSDAKAEQCVVGGPGNLTDLERADVIVAILKEGVKIYNQEIAAPKGIPLLSTDMNVKVNMDAAYKALASMDGEIVPSLDRFYDLCGPQKFDYEVGTFAMAKVVAVAIYTDPKVANILKDKKVEFAIKIKPSNFMREISAFNGPNTILAR